ncbi:hypothetical protein BIW11_06073 [Tropilaelaps mercedesae]|uniref:Uncharacterized protein n=1 Tax=Tropilaelaps mercedesae TaxID=418985 RepID=A0A1V9XZS0_9ACAR|nr:hypothetical protein BIW11_06073 [Tropilaelaps mercedesae]
MVKIGLEFCANLENLVSISPADDSYVWYLKLKCGCCGEITDNWISLELHEKQSLRDGRGDANIVIKCKFCLRVNTMDILPDTRNPYSNSDEFQLIVVFDCRGIEPVDFDPREGWVAKTEDGRTFTEVDLTEKEWVDYDDKRRQTVGVYEVKSKFRKL